MKKPDSFISVSRQFSYESTSPCVVNRAYVVCATYREGLTELKTVNDEQIVFSEPSYNTIVQWLAGEIETGISPELKAKEQ